MIQNISFKRNKSQKTLHKAILELKKETHDYGGKFIQERDLAFLNYYKNNINKN